MQFLLKFYLLLSGIILSLPSLSSADSSITLTATPTFVSKITQYDVEQLAEKKRYIGFVISIMQQNTNIDQIVQLFNANKAQADEIKKHATFNCIDLSKKPVRRESCIDSKKNWDRINFFIDLSEHSEEEIFFTDKTCSKCLNPIMLKKNKFIELINQIAIHTYDIKVSINESAHSFLSILKYATTINLSSVLATKSTFDISSILPPAIQNDLNRKNLLKRQSCHAFALRFIRGLYDSNEWEPDTTAIDLIFDEKIRTKYFNKFDFDKELLKFGDLIHFDGQHTAIYIGGDYVLMKDDTSEAYSYRYAKLNDFAIDAPAKFDYIRYLQPTPTKIYRWNGTQF